MAQRQRLVFRNRNVVNTESAEAPGSRDWFAGGTVLVEADAGTLTRAITSADVRLVVPQGSGTAELVATTPAARLTATVRFASLAEGRRRALLAALDLLRKAVA